MIRVFVSSRMCPDELTEERATVISAIREMGGIPVAFEVEPASAQHWREWWRERIPQCDAFVVLLDETLGEGVLDEVLTAGRERVPTFMFARDLNRVVRDRALDPSMCDSPPSDIESFYEAVSTPKAKQFSDLEDLRRQLRRAITEDNGLRQRLFGQLAQVRATFVEPIGFAEWQNSLADRSFIVIDGPPHVGKTATAIMLLLDVLHRNQELRFNRLGGNTGPMDVNRAAVLWDDFVPDRVQPGGRLHDQLEALCADPGERVVVATTRSDRLQAYSSQSSRFAELQDRLPISTMAPGEAFDDAMRREILDRHIEWFQGNPTPEGEVDVTQAALARGDADWICEHLAFPHNIAVFCGHLLPQVHEPDELRSAVLKAQEIKRAVRAWLAPKPDADKTLSTLLCLFRDAVDIEAALGMARGVGCEWAGRADADLWLERACGAYLSTPGIFGPQHSSYAGAVLEDAGEHAGVAVAAISHYVSNVRRLPKAEPQHIEYLLCRAFYADRMTADQRRFLVDHALLLADSEPWRHVLLREAMLAWRADISYLYPVVFAQGDPLLLWGAGRILAGVRDALPPEARDQFELLLVAAHRAASARNLAGPDHDRPSPYEGIFGHLDQLSPGARDLLRYQCYADPREFAHQYARDITAHWPQCEPAWRWQVLQAVENAQFPTRERAVFALAERSEMLGPDELATLLAQAEHELGIRRVPALRALWRYRDRVPQVHEQALGTAVARADPAALEALFRPADWWSFPSAEIEAMGERVGDGELALLGEYQAWAETLHQDFDDAVFERHDWEPGPICHGLALMSGQRPPVTELASELSSPSHYRRLAAMMRCFQVERGEEAELEGMLDVLVAAFGTLPDALKPPVVAEISAQAPKLSAARSFVERIDVTDTGDMQKAFESGRQLARQHEHPSRRLHAAYPTLYLALLARGDPVEYTDCAVARLRSRSQGLYGLGRWTL